MIMRRKLSQTLHGLKLMYCNFFVFRFELAQNILLFTFYFILTILVGIMMAKMWSLIDGLK
jgi:hypothetical protein